MVQLWIFEKDSGRFLGGAGLELLQSRAPDGESWLLGADQRGAGRGIATQAARLVARFGFEQLGLQRIEIVAAVGNIASQRVAEKAGATREAVLRKRLLINGESQDAVLFSLVAEDLA